MKLLYMIPDRFGKYEIDQPPSPKNPGGGMGSKAQRAIVAWSAFYDVEVSEVLVPGHDLLVMEPLWFRFRGHSGELAVPDFEESVSAYENYPATLKVLYSSELAMMELPRRYRDRIFNASTVVTSDCDFQERIYEMLGQPSVRLCDTVPEDIFYNPRATKRVSVIAMSRISLDKNSEKVAEIFKALDGYPIERIYIGGAGLWGHTNSLDGRIEQEIRSNCDTFYHNIPQRPLARILSESGCAIFDTFHDTCADSNLEALIAGVVCLYGSHGLWRERPGVHDLVDVQDFVDALEQLTNGFKKAPPRAKRLEAEQWALDNCSYEHFLKEWRGILAHARNK